jgi:hypothetical protein
MSTASVTCWEFRKERLCIGDWVHVNGVEGIFLRMEDRDSLCVKPNDPVIDEVCVWIIDEMSPRTVRVLRQKRVTREMYRGTLLYYVRR